MDAECCTKAKRSIHLDASAESDKGKRRKLQPKEEEKEVTLEVQPYEWVTGCINQSDGSLVVRCWCKDRDCRVHLLKFDGFELVHDISGTAFCVK